MPTSYEKLSALLKELFQLDQADLDFGIYRIMNQKRDEITRFLDSELLPQVKASFKQYHPADKKVLEDSRSRGQNQARLAFRSLRCRHQPVCSRTFWDTAVYGIPRQYWRQRCASSDVSLSAEYRTALSLFDKKPGGAGAEGGRGS